MPKLVSGIAILVVRETLNSLLFQITFNQGCTPAVVLPQHYCYYIKDLSEIILLF